MNTAGMKIGLLAAALVLGLPASQAGQQSDTMQVTIAVEAACTITANDLDFGTVNEGFSDARANTTVVVRCPDGLPWEVGLNGGLTPLGSGSGNRQMLYGGGSANGGAEIAYILTRSDFASWVDREEATPGGNVTEMGIGTGADQSLLVNGYAYPLGSVVPGAYSDTVTATIYF
jgi:spore coat protein U-like protein